MKTIFGYKKWIALALASTMATSSYGQTNLPELDKELEIMTSILNTALKQNSDKSAVRFRGLDATYLANQGVVFRVSLSGASSGFNFVFSTNEDMEFFSIPPVPPVPEISGDANFTIEFGDDSEWQDFAEEAVERAREAMEEARHKLREVRQKEREYSWEKRELERRIRDHEFEMRNADEKRKKELMRQNEELQDELKTLEKKQSETEKYAEELENARKQKAAAQAKARQEQHKAFLSNFEDNVANTLCKYGAGLKALPDSENVTFVLPDFAVDGRDKKDRIYVFSVKDVQSCVKDRIDSAKLLQKSAAYMF